MSQHSADPAIASEVADLLARHKAARARRNAAALGSPEFETACEEIAAIEVEIARLERSVQPPRV